MRKYLWLILIISGINFNFKAMADEVKEKTDNSFVGWTSQEPINSSFVGDISDSMVNESWGKEDLSQKTDSRFVGDGTIQAGNTYFAGDSSDKEEDKETNTPFAGDRPFVGSDYGK